MPRAMIRALTTLIGLACAAALLLLVPDVGAAAGGGLWKRAALFAAAGLVAGVVYQLGGIRRPGVVLNLPLLLGAFLPWTLLADLMPHPRLPERAPPRLRARRAARGRPALRACRRRGRGDPRRAGASA